ncbi:hypothetical protein AGMMS50229_07460 [Campylobacterota bacterium]|nr:hypothetical protein AGMMS50229_07460 [Campylobacterota bacterium]
MNDFESGLKKSPRFVFVCGDLFLCEHYARIYTKTLSSELSVLKLYYSEFDPQIAVNHISQMGLFGSGNLLIVRVEKKFDIKTLNALYDATIKTAKSYTVVIYEAEKADDLKAKVAAMEGKNGALAQRFYTPKPNEAARFLTQRAVDFDLAIEESAANHLLKLHDYNLALAASELEKLAIYNDSSERMIDQISAGHSDGDLFRLTTRIIDRQPFYDLLDIVLQNEEPMAVLLGIISDFRKLFMFAVASRINLMSRDFLGYSLPKEIEHTHSRLAQKLSIDRFTVALTLLSELELAFKQTEVRDKNALLTATLIRLQAKL